MIDYTYSQGESPTVFNIWNGAEKIARITGTNKSQYTVHMNCGITLSNKYDTHLDAIEAAGKFFFDNFYLDIIKKAGK